MAKKELRTRTTDKEKLKRFEYINGKMMTKYLDLIWFARADPDTLIEEEKYELVQNVINSLQKIADKYTEDVIQLESDDTNWQHGFNSGVLAYARFLSSYIEDTLWKVCKENHSMVPYEKVVTIDGVDYIEFNGRQDARDSFPDLST